MRWFKRKHELEKYFGSPDEQLRMKIQIERGGIDAVKKEINKENIDYLVDALTPLQIAVMKDNIELISYFIDCGADINKYYPDGSTPLILALGQRRDETVEFLLEKGADPNLIHKSTNTTAIWYATTNINSKIVEKLIEYGADPFTDFGNGMSAYQMAKAMQLIEVIEVMEKK